MLNKELCEKFMLVDMNDVDISTEDNPVIGTQALATCVGVLLYNEKQKKAIVAHVSSNVEEMLKKLISYIYFYKFDSDKIKYLVIQGYYKSGYLVDEQLEDFCSSFDNFIKFTAEEIPSFALEKDESTTSVQFAFDTLDGKFVTDKVLFGIDYLDFKKL